MCGSSRPHASASAMARPAAKAASEPSRWSGSVCDHRDALAMRSSAGSKKPTVAASVGGTSSQLSGSASIRSAHSSASSRAASPAGEIIVLVAPIEGYHSGGPAWCR